MRIFLFNRGLNIPHIKVGTKVKVKGYSPAYNDIVGEVVDREGAYYKVRITIEDEVLDLYDLYSCELEEIGD